MTLRFDLASAYTSPGNIDFNADNNHMSTDAADGPWINAMRNNLADAFTCTAVTQ